MDLLLRLQRRPTGTVWNSTLVSINQDIHRLSSPFFSPGWQCVGPSSAPPLTPPRPPCGRGPCLLLRPLLSVYSHLDPSFNRLCRICLAPLTFPQNPPAPACHPARCPHSLTLLMLAQYGGATAVARLAVISRFHFSKSRDIELRLRTPLCLPAASVLRPVRLGGDQERWRLQDVIPADTRGGGGGSRLPRQ